MQGSSTKGFAFQSASQRNSPIFSSRPRFPEWKPRASMSLWSFVTSMTIGRPSWGDKAPPGDMRWVWARGREAASGTPCNLGSREERTEASLSRPALGRSEETRFDTRGTDRHHGHCEFRQDRICRLLSTYKAGQVS